VSESVSAASRSASVASAGGLGLASRVRVAGMRGQMLFQSGFAIRSRANSVQIRQSRPDSGLSLSLFQAKVMSRRTWAWRPVSESVSATSLLPSVASAQGRYTATWEREFKRPVDQIIAMITWIRTSRLTIKTCLISRRTWAWRPVSESVYIYIYIYIYIHIHISSAPHPCCLASPLPSEKGAP